MIHSKAHEAAGKTVRVKQLSNDPDGLSGQEYRLEDWWDRVAGQSWGSCRGNPACLKYAMRTGFSNPAPPMDDEVVYGKVGCLGHLLHVSEIDFDGGA